MRQSTLALACGLILFVVLAYSWCGRNPPQSGSGLQATPTPTPPPVAANPQTTAGPSVSLAQVTVTTPAQTAPLEFQKVAAKVAPAIIEITVRLEKGQRIQSGNAFFFSRDGQLVTSWTKK